jgi:hypothetical protein
MGRRRSSTPRHQRLSQPEHPYCREQIVVKFLPLPASHALIATPSHVNRVRCSSSAEIPPEEVDEGKDTAPSKRIITHVPEYEGRKASAGPLIAANIGLAHLRKRCPHFDAWLSGLSSSIGANQHVEVTKRQGLLSNRTKPFDGEVSELWLLNSSLDIHGCA